MKEIHLSNAVRPAAAQEALWKGARLDDTSYDVLLTDDADVYKPDGEILLQFRKNVLPAEMCARAYRVMRNVGGDATNRGVAAIGKAEISKRADGTLSKTSRVLITKKSHPELLHVGSGVIGYMDRMSARFPYCRETAFNLDHPALFAECMDYIQAVDGVFRRVSPLRHAAQLAVVARTHPDFVIHGTAFTTVTVNKNFRTMTHQDAGDLKEGFGVMSVLRGGRYTGGFTVFPEFRVAASMSTGDVLLADVHEWHGNTPIVGKTGAYERVTCVFYYREKMQFCASAAEELEYAKNRKLGTPLIERPGVRPTAATRGYDRQWRNLQKEYIAANPYCEIQTHCPLGAQTPAVEVDHKLTVRDRPDLRLDWGNLQSGCKACHAAKTRAEMAAAAAAGSK